MIEDLSQKYDPVVVMVNRYRGNVWRSSWEGNSKNNSQIRAGLSDAQYAELKTRRNIPSGEFPIFIASFSR